MTKVLLDVNVVLDVMLNRSPHAGRAATIWTAVENGRRTGLLSAHAVTTIHYLISKERGVAVADRAVHALLRVFQVATVDIEVLQRALHLSFSDFEDAVSAAAAEKAACDAIVTRDTAGFRKSPIRVLAPEAAAALLGSTA